MSLKAFHIFFISLAALSAFGFAVWSIMQWMTDGNLSLVFVAAGSTLCGVGLIIYGIRFLRKLKHVSFI